MDLFKSVMSEYDHQQEQQQPDSPDSTQSPLDDPTTPSSSSWSFGNLIKTLATKSESVIGSYRRDFEEFGSELKKETSVIRQVASRAVKDLPDSLEIGASVAQESLESVGQAIDDIGATVWKSTAKIISHGKESLLSSSSSSSGLESSGGDDRRNQNFSAKPYSRFEMQLLAIQSDKETYVREPDDSGDFENWVLGFKFEEKESEIVGLINGNKAVKEIYEEIVPVEVDAESFWRRYFYKVYKLEQAEEARVKLVKRAISGEEDEDLSWDLDDEGDENETGKGNERGSEKAERREVSSQESDISVISTQPSLPEVEDLGWDQMEEDIRSNEEGRSLEAGQGSEEKSDWRRRVSVAEEEEDLNWDIEEEDDDDSVKQ
uniref:BSD domain-containing protein 1 n=1 Tax=Noccaea caerulescens TaxID=107243 RepID=A0A1J3JLR3_NOCCA